MKRPSRRDINNILKRQINGWNDRRVGYNRIKLMTRLVPHEVTLLQTELSVMFPNYQFLIEDYTWHSFCYGSRIVTTVKYSAI